jgi:hypothetical protein
LEGGEDLPFMVDTGCRFTILDKSLEPRLGKRLGTRRTDFRWYPGKASWGIYAAPKLSLNDFPLRIGNRVFTEDLTRIWPGRPMMGILGMDCLGQYCLQFDFVSKEMSFRDPEQLDTSALGYAFPLTFCRGCASARMDFYDRRGAAFLLDTADYTDGALRSDLFRLVAEKQSAVWIRQGRTSAGSLNRLVYPEECQMAGSTYTNLVFRDCSVGSSSSENILGLRFLARHLVTFNFPKSVMYLKVTSLAPPEISTSTIQPNPQARTGGSRAARGQIRSQRPLPPIAHPEC